MSEILQSVSDLFSFVGDLADEIGTILGGDEETGETTIPVVLPLVLAGPSGAGKNSLIRMLMKEFPDDFGYSIAHTTRQPRQGERHGVDYYFTTTGVMVSMIDAGDFLETAQVHGNIYGTAKSSVQQVADSGKICVLDIDTLGVKSIKKADLDPSPMFVFVKPVTLEALGERLRARGVDPEDVVQKKLQSAAGELSYAEENKEDFDHTVVNDDLTKCYEELKAILDDNITAARQYRALLEQQKKEAAAAEAAKLQAAAAKGTSSDTSPKEVEMKAMPNDSAADPQASLKALIKQKEEELDAANATKDRNKAKQLLSEIEVLEAQLK